MVHNLSDGDISTDTFTFTFTASPAFKFSFDQPVSIPVPLKRRRALSDVDGDGNEGRKKRRLRLHLITSRLSRPYSLPATNIVNRGSSKIAAWARNRAVGKNELRKAAIMNRVRLSMDAAKDFMRLEHERRRGTMALREMVQKPRCHCHEIPLPPSPLGLSNYDAFDLEDEQFDEQNDDGGGIDRTSSIYSDFNIMNPISSDGDDYDYLDVVDGIQPEDLQDLPPHPPEETILEILRENEETGDGYFIRVGG